MDYSTISNKTNRSSIESDELTNGEINERYYLLKKQYDNLSSSYDAMKQELHDTKRSYQTALDIQSHLNLELESFQAQEAKGRSELNSRIASLQEEISQLREEHSEITDRHEAEIKKFEKQIRDLKEEQVIKVRDSPERDNTELEESRNAAALALADAESAKTALEEARNEIVSWRVKTTELSVQVDEMRAAAELRKEELQAASEREAVALADLAEARAMLHQSTHAQDLQPHATKGNSIFAEVEDKRQEMAKNLISMKQTNSRLRRELANKQAEVENLLHEKQTVWEQQAGAAAHYDRELIESYEERISRLEGLCERRRRELARWFSKLNEPSINVWLSGVLEHLTAECEQLRTEVLARGAEQLASAVHVRELRRKLATLTANSAKVAISPNNGVKVEQSDKALVKLDKEAQVRNIKPNPVDVKKKVCFN